MEIDREVEVPKALRDDMTALRQKLEEAASSPQNSKAMYNFLWEMVTDARALETEMSRPFWETFSIEPDEPDEL